MELTIKEIRELLGLPQRDSALLVLNDRMKMLKNIYGFGMLFCGVVAVVAFIFGLYYHSTFLLSMGFIFVVFDMVGYAIKTEVIDPITRSYEELLAEKSRIIGSYEELLLMIRCYCRHHEIMNDAKAEETKKEAANNKNSTRLRRKFREGVEK